MDPVVKIWMGTVLKSTEHAESNLINEKLLCLLTFQGIGFKFQSSRQFIQRIYMAKVKPFLDIDLVTACFDGFESSNKFWKNKNKNLRGVTEKQIKWYARMEEEWIWSIFFPYRNKVKFTIPIALSVQWDTSQFFYTKMFGIFFFHHGESCFLKIILIRNHIFRYVCHKYIQ